MNQFFLLSKAFSWFSQICGSLYSAKCWGFDHFREASWA